MVSPPAERITPPAVKRRPFLGFAALAALFALALSVRLVGIDLFITPDEDNWMRRTGNFAQALQSGDLWQTFQSGHPGVTIMWIARLGIGSEVARLSGLTIVDGPVTRQPGFMDMLVRGRRAMVLANTTLLVICVALGWRLFGAGPALLGGLLLALDPFLIAHSQVVHVDALSAGFICVAMLAAGVYWWRGGGWGYLVLCGIASGLAVLTKAPSLFLGVLVPAVALLAPVVDRERWSWAGVLRTLIVAGLLGLLTVVLLWPAIWVAPERTLLEAIDFTLATSSEHRPGNFFLGQAVADPGPIFYPVAIVFRLAPLTLAGLVAVGVLLPPRSMKAPSLLLLLYIAGFLLFLTIPSKKLDRYALPVFPALGLLAGVGFWTLGTWLVQAARRRWPDLHRAAIAVPIGLLALGQVMPLLMVAPYPLAYYNPLMGGAPAATRVMLVGWGEGLDQVAAYLNAQPNASRQRIAIYFPLVLNFAGMVEGSVSQIGATRPVDYVVDYVNATQRGQTPGVVASQTPDLVVRINGVVYARVFKVSPARPAF